MKDQSRARKAPAARIIALLLLCLIGVAASLMFGVRTIDASAVFDALAGKEESVDQAAAAARIPRTVLGLIIGAALALSGTSLQAVTRNPLADPGIFGILSGASLAVVVMLAWGDISDPLITMFVAMIGAGVAALGVFFLGSVGGSSPIKLALAGAVIAAASSSISAAILLPRVDVMDNFRFWQIGGIGGADWHRLMLAAPLLIIGALLVASQIPGLNALALGDVVATNLGQSPARVRLISFIGAVVLCGTSVALAGPIAFVGLVVPHLARAFVGLDYRVLIPASALCGACLLVLADTAGRVIARPEEISVGIIMPIIGAPVLLWLVSAGRKIK